MSDGAMGFVALRGVSGSRINPVVMVGDSYLWYVVLLKKIRRDLNPDNDWLYSIITMTRN